MRWHTKPKANGVAAWTCNRAEADLFSKMMRSNGLKIKTEKERLGYTSWDGSTHLYSIRVMGSAEDVLRGRELRRGFKVAMQLRGDVYDFCEGLRAGLLAAKQAGLVYDGPVLKTAKRKRSLRDGFKFESSALRQERKMLNEKN